MIIYLNCDNNDTTFNKKNYLLRAAERNGLSFMFKDAIEAKNLLPEYVLNIVPYTGLVVGSRWTGVWELDQLCNRNQAGQDWPYVETVFLTSSSIPSNAIVPCEEKHHLLFQACDPHLHDRMGCPKFDVVQCGSGGDGVYAERSRRLSLIEKKYSFWDFGKNYHLEDYVRNISQARVQFIQTGVNEKGEGELAQRFFECLAIGPVLTNWCQDLQHTGLVDGEDFMSYKNDEEMFQKLDLLLKDEDLRNRIARNGRRKALMYHTYDHRLVAIYHTALFERKGLS